MIEIRPATNADIKDVATLVAELNARESDHITYLSETVASVRYSFENELCEIPLDQSFLLAFEDERLIAVCGLEIDLKRHKGYVWGPWIRHENWDMIVNELWAQLHGLLKDQVSEIQMAPEAENRRCQKLAGRVGLSLYKEPSYVLRLTTATFSPLPVSEIMELNELNREAFIRLHDTLFPKTYYNAREIIDRLSDTNKLFMTTNGLAICTARLFLKPARQILNL